MHEMRLTEAVQRGCSCRINTRSSTLSCGMSGRHNINTRSLDITNTQSPHSTCLLSVQHVLFIVDRHRNTDVVKLVRLIGCVSEGRAESGAGRCL